MLVQLPPYAIATPVFRFRALAMHAGRGALGGEREVALACLAVARLADGMTSRFVLPPGDIATRCMSAKQWLASLTLPNNARASAAAVIDAVALGNRRAVGGEVKSIAATCAPQLDQASVNELNDLSTELAVA
jgi:hypothetical protein